MEYNSRAQQNPVYRTQSSSSSNYTYFTEQAIRAGFPSGRIGGVSHVGPERFRGPSDMREEIQREIEKERIREEIIAEEIARKRVLEAEVRRELMMEREMMAMRSAGRGFSPPFMAFPPPTNQYNRFEPRIPFRQPLGGDGRSFEERIAMSIEEKYGGGGCHDIGGFEITPFQRLGKSPKIKEIIPKDSKQEVIILDKPGGETLSGAKRKAATPAAEASSELRTDGLKKKPKEEWSCAICQVSATSERGLNEHLGGKKHQAKEAALRAQRTGANLGLGVSPKKPTTKPVKLALTTTVKPSSSEKQVKKDKKLVKSPPLAINNSGADSNDSKKEDVKSGSEDRREKFKFWCEMCQAGAFNEKVMNNHKKGKKHLTRLLELHRRGVFAPAAATDGRTEMVQDSDDKSEVGTKKSEELRVAGEVNVVNAMDDKSEAGMKKAEELRVVGEVSSVNAMDDKSEAGTKKAEELKVVGEVSSVNAMDDKSEAGTKKAEELKVVGEVSSVNAMDDKSEAGTKKAEELKVVGEVSSVNAMDDKSEAGTKKAEELKVVGEVNVVDAMDDVTGEEDGASVVTEKADGGADEGNKGKADVVSD